MTAAPLRSRSAPSRLALVGRRVKATRKGRVVRLRVRCVGETRCRGVAVARSVDGLRRVLGKGRVNLAAGRSGTVVLRLTPRARRLLRQGSLGFRLTL